jgi:hypothetical protein
MADHSSHFKYSGERGDENCDGFTERGEVSMDEHKGKHTKEKMKRHPCQRLQTPGWNPQSPLVGREK